MLFLNSKYFFKYVFYRRGLHLIVSQLTVGDYVISPELAIERKALTDLQGSLWSGRLYTQCTHLERNFEVPVVLVELDWKDKVLETKLDPNKTIDSRRKLSPNDLARQESTPLILMNKNFIQQISYLVKNFQKIHFFWTGSGESSSKLIEKLKKSERNKQSPVPESTDSDLGRSASFDFLVKLPGVGSVEKAKVVMKSVKNLKELFGKSKSDLKQITGNDKLWEFIHVEGEYK